MGLTESVINTSDKLLKEVVQEGSKLIEAIFTACILILLTIYLLFICVFSTRDLLAILGVFLLYRFWIDHYSIKGTLFGPSANLLLGGLKKQDHKHHKQAVTKYHIRTRCGDISGHCLQGHCIIDHDGWMKHIDKKALATCFEEYVDELGSVLIRVASGAYKGYFLSAEWNKGVGAWPRADAAKFEWFKADQSLMCKSYKSAGFMLSLVKDGPLMRYHCSDLGSKAVVEKEMVNETGVKRYRLKTQHGYCKLDTAGWMISTETMSEATTFEERFLDSTHMHIVANSGMWRGYFLSAEQGRGVGAWKERHDAARWEWDSDCEKLVCRLFKSSGKYLALRASKDSEPRWHCCDKSTPAICSTELVSTQSYFIRALPPTSQNGKTSGHLGYCKIDRDGFMCLTESCADATLFEDDKEHCPDGNLLMLIASGCWEGCWLSSHRDDGVCAATQYKDAAYWAWISDKFLICKNFKSAGQKVALDEVSVAPRHRFYCRDAHTVLCFERCYYDSPPRKRSVFHRL
eukprot:gnl/TRDRNA2_/TRDRNA2_205324_c0_seq1.p1 gnl/TRDRNA2_/TRDRNA2_205324_c0~~gnl/TRDRNA2_/TRDRNA2_205324_c0_seq1.p1  ORF type:complete len:517 (-),score=71.39 gnl/TRDRNA2_/TRDRNA2_205324_c0_seq1:28-1578(-)